MFTREDTHSHTLTHVQAHLLPYTRFYTHTFKCSKIGALIGGVIVVNVLEKKIQ